MAEAGQGKARRLIRPIILAVLLGVGVYALLAVLGDVGKVKDALRGFGWGFFAAALGLAFANYVARFLKWHYYLKCLSIDLPARESFVMFLSGFVMAVTPGKFGEVIKSVLLKERLDVPVARSAPIVLAERLTDLIAILLLALAGSVSFRSGWVFMIAGFAITTGIVLAVTVRPIGEAALGLVARLPLVGRLAPKLGEAYESTHLMARWDRLLGPVAISVVAWFCECVAFWMVIRGFGERGVDLFEATFIYAFSTAAGALAMMPGGLGVTEGGLTGLLLKMGPADLGRDVAVGATILTRLATLWFAVLVGMISLSIYTRVWLGKGRRSAGR